MHTRVFLVLFTSLCLLATPLVGAANTDSIDEQRLFDAANAAFRSGDYSQALANYNDAMVAGRKDSRLFYNMGLTHYRLGQYPQAKWSFTEAAKDDALAAISYYQLGAVAEKEDNSIAAKEWYKRSRDNASGPKLKARSRDALEALGVSQPEFTAVFSAGFGNDSNAFRAPNTPYIDLSQTLPTPVVPIEQSGTYVPVRINAAYENAVSAQSQFVAAYRHRGVYYSDSALSNADETDHRFTLGLQRDLGQRGSRDERLSFGAVIRSHAESNFDRDDGLDRFDDGSSIIDRYNFTSFGAEAELRNRVGRYRYTVEGGFTQRDYDEVPTASSYDLTSYWLGGAFKIPLADTTRFKIAYEFRARDFDQRHAKDATGDSSGQNPTLEYQYHQFEAGIRHRISEVFVAEVVYFYTIRDDKFVGYNDYTKGKFRLKTEFEMSPKLDANITVDFRDQDYSNAFAFDDPSQPAKEYQEFQVSARVAYRFTEQLALRLDLKQEVVESSDPRGEYDRTRASIGVSWRF